MHIQRRGSIVVTVLIVIGIMMILVALMLPAQRTARPSARRTQCRNNLKQIALALHYYESEYHALPPAYTVDENGKPLHSWRTLILPFMEETALFGRIDLAKAWDDPANAKALNTHISSYQCPELAGPEHHTTYMAIVTPESSFRAAEPRPLCDITDNHAETIIVVEVDLERSFPWMAPRDADESMFLALGALKQAHTGGMHAACVAGSVQFLNATMNPQLRRGLISIAGNEPLGL